MGNGDGLMLGDWWHRSWWVGNGLMLDDGDIGQG